MKFQHFLKMDGEPGASGGGGAPAASSEGNSGQPAPGQAEEKNQQPGAQSPEKKAEQKAAAQAAARLEKFSYVVDGKEVEEEIDLNNREELAKRFRLSAAATKRMSEAKEAQQKARQIIEAFDKNPVEMLKRLGPNGRQIAEQFLVQSLQEEMMDPKDKELRQYKAEVDKYKSKEALDKQAKEQQQQQARETKIAQDFQKTIIDAAQQSGLPKSPALIKRIAKVLHTNVDLGLDLSPADLAAEVKKDLIAEIKSIIGDSEGSHLIDLFGPDVAKKIRKFDLQRLQESQQKLSGGFGNPQNNNPNPAPKAEPNHYLTPDQWKEQVNKRISQAK